MGVQGNKTEIRLQRTGCHVKVSGYRGGQAEGSKEVHRAPSEKREGAGKGEMHVGLS